MKLALLGGLVFGVGYAIGLLHGRLWESVLRLESHVVSDGADDGN